MSTRSAFTLIELLIAITILAILIGLVLTAGPALQFRARVATTTSKMDAVTAALSSYALAGEGAAASLQRAGDLGGVHRFATVKELLNLIPNYTGPNGAKGENSQRDVLMQADNLWQNTKNWPPDYWRRSFIISQTRRLIIIERLRSEVADCVPNRNSDLIQSWYGSTGSEIQWPTRWKQPDWDLPAPGSVPPILRFPWGKPGLRINGTPCEKQIAAGIVVPGAVDPVSDNYPATTDKVLNAWCTMGNDSGSLMTFTNADTIETDSVLSVVAKRSNGVEETIPVNNPLPFDLGHCSPMRSIVLLQAAGVLAPGAVGADAYRSDRNPNRPWNDAWGNPLVTVYALFQPERFFRDGDKWNRRDKFLRASGRVYQFDRELYLSVGAIGPRLKANDMTPAWPAGKATWTETQDPVALRNLWLQIRTSTRAWEWTESAWIEAPPWRGIRVGDVKDPLDGRLRGLVSAPVALQ